MLKNVRIYNINTKSDASQLYAFMNMEFLEKSGCSVDPINYIEVFRGDLPNCNNLDDIYCELNSAGHPLLHGHSLSVSDVVIMDDKAYFCDSFGWKEIEFDETLTVPQELNKIVYVEPNQKPYVSYIGKSLEAEQAAVCGLIELVDNGDGTFIVCNEEAKYYCMPGNRRFDWGIIAGPFFVIGDDGENFRSLTDEEVDKYLQLFAEPEEIPDEEVQADCDFHFVAW